MASSARDCIAADAIYFPVNIGQGFLSRDQMLHHLNQDSTQGP